MSLLLVSMCMQILSLFLQLFVLVEYTYGDSYKKIEDKRMPLRILTEQAIIFFWLFWARVFKVHNDTIATIKMNNCNNKF